MYDMTRKGEVFERPFRDITIKSLKAVSYANPDLVLDVLCSKGTYIRSLAHDLGQLIGCGGYLADLRRTSVGRFNLKDAVTLEQLAELKAQDLVADRLVPISQALDFSTLVISDVTSDHVLHGQLPCWSEVVEVEGDFRSGDTVLLKDVRRGALAIAIAASDSRAARIPSARSVESFVRVLA
jgi:tRNA pseudouridine55 synthase